MFCVLGKPDMCYVENLGEFGWQVKSVPDGHLGEFVWQIESRIGYLSRVREITQRELIKTGHG